MSLILSFVKNENIMKNIFILGITFLAFSSGLFSQDYIYLRDQQQRIAAKNISISATEIWYEDYSSSEGHLYSIKPELVSLIAYENGEVRVIKSRAKDMNTYDFKKNLITYHLSDLIISNFTMSYERILQSGKLGIQIPVSFGYASGTNFGNNVLISKFYSGVYVNFYPNGQGKVRYLLGPGIRIGVGHDNHNSNSQNYTDTFYGKLLINNGVVFSPIPDLSLSAVLSLGIRYYPEAVSYNKDVRTTAAFTFNLSYRF
ncbi:MAG: hypothetical protein DRI88_08530 [Bacteroidetes bacterium]|nr:MAG: hypothetical protein DRI88_08530 [Bacteroidota bacterium]RLD89869.1 MAG: hypothetical protein DRJ02_00295 [Bacteroidota bacterium]